MPVAVRSFGKINIGLHIGPRREDGFHGLRTIYQTIAISDLLRVDVGRGVGIDIYCKDQRVPTDEANTCWKVADKVLRSFKVRGKVRITIEKNLPVQGGLGAASSNAVATLLAMEKVLKRQLPVSERLRITEDVGSDLPLFLVGGTVLGIGRGEQVYPLEDLPALPCVVATPSVGVSTPAAFSDWDKKQAGLTAQQGPNKIELFSQTVYEWMNGSSFSPSGVPDKGWSRAEALLLDLVRTGIENEFEAVVFSKYPAIREAKRALEKSGAKYVSLSGSGSTVYGLYSEMPEATKAANTLEESGLSAQATMTLTRQEYWKQMFPG